MDTNITNIRKQIIMKNGTYILYYLQMSSRSTRTDYIHFHIQDGIEVSQKQTEPIVAEREAGVRNPLLDSCYELPQPPIEDNYPQHCFKMLRQSLFFVFRDVKPGNINQVQQRVNNMCIQI